ncbi:MAG: hypothetical protein AVDCRST_MAG07-1894, partial [uncultured Frankineae bacterium]
GAVLGRTCGPAARPGRVPDLVRQRMAPWPRAVRVPRRDHPSPRDPRAGARHARDPRRVRRLGAHPSRDLRGRQAPGHRPPAPARGAAPPDGHL